MGVDAEIAVKFNSPISQSELDKLNKDAKEFFCAFGSDNLSTFDGDDPFYVDEDECTLVRLSTLHRYYGPFYERGPWIILSSIILFLKYRFPEAAVFYGGDNTEYPSPMTEENFGEIWTHFARVGHRPYYKNDPQ